ncbi:hypothetical protein BIW11_02529 [Tropilaelaps mercedesae]|uniref:Uncharacterized protein n=1 Tax=Tropilaelaps mercedesae TaxID=418985 RepID=A0A1V9Y1P7_9ACAR|nr:hypothetical protein BIW11_02529 [Tropilaelaps mercedesae]
MQRFSRRLLVPWIVPLGSSNQATGSGKSISAHSTNSRQTKFPDQWIEFVYQPSWEGKKNSRDLKEHIKQMKCLEIAVKEA